MRQRYQHYPHRRRRARVSYSTAKLIILATLGLIAVIGMSPEQRAELFRFKYPNCDAVRAAGAAPISRGQYGWSDDLDADQDGVGCEPYPR